MSTLNLEFQKALSANSTAAAFTAQKDEAVVPASNIYVPAIAQESIGDVLHILPYGTNADGETFSMRVWGWNKLRGSSLWLPQLLLDADFTLGSLQFTDTTNYPDTFFVDTITVNHGVNIVKAVDGEANQPCGIMLDFYGAQPIEFDFAQGTAAEMNAFVRIVKS